LVRVFDLGLKKEKGISFSVKSFNFLGVLVYRCGGAAAEGGPARRATARIWVFV
jgi:hypothetical protein